MSQTNPFTPPRSHVADLNDFPEMDIDSLPVSDTWKKRFNGIRKAGGPSMPNLKSMSREERKGLSLFNILAFLFGPFYYLAKGMWRKSISLLAVCLAAVLILEFLLTMIGFERFSRSLGYGIAAVFAIRANVDYYKKMVLGENGWW